MTMAMENYIVEQIEEIIKSHKNPQDVWDIVEDKFGDAGLVYLEDMDYPEPPQLDEGITVV